MEKADQKALVESWSQACPSLKVVGFRAEDKAEEGELDLVHQWEEMCVEKGAEGGGSQWNRAVVAVRIDKRW